MLNHSKSLASLSESFGDGRKLDCFRPGSDEQPYIFGTQSSPSLGRSNLPPLWMKCKEAARTLLAEVVGV